MTTEQTTDLSLPRRITALDLGGSVSITKTITLEQLSRSLVAVEKKRLDSTMRKAVLRATRQTDYAYDIINGSYLAGDHLVLVSAVTRIK